MKDGIKIKKGLIRKKILEKRNYLTAAERLEKSNEISSRINKIPEINKSKSIFMYVSFRSEVSTHGLINFYLDQGKIVSVPFTDINKKMIIPSIIKSFKKDLVPGSMGILEPPAEKIKPISADEIDIIILPGAVFNLEGCRIGYGGGFYDRFLQKSKVRSYALAFDLQLVDEIPFDPQFDMKVDFIVTEKRIVNCG